MVSSVSAIFACCRGFKRRKNAVNPNKGVQVELPRKGESPSSPINNMDSLREMELSPCDDEITLSGKDAMSGLGDQPLLPVERPAESPENEILPSTNEETSPHIVPSTDETVFSREIRSMRQLRSERRGVMERRRSVVSSRTSVSIASL